MSAVMGSEPLVFSTVLPPSSVRSESFLTRAYEQLLYSNGGYPSDHRHPAPSRTAHRDSTK